MNRQPKKGDLLKWIGGDDVVLVLTDAVPDPVVRRYTIFWYYHMNHRKKMTHSALHSRQLKDWTLLSSGEE